MVCRNAVLKLEIRCSPILVSLAKRAGVVVEYVYAGLEQRSRKELREPARFIHDVTVDGVSRRTGVVTVLVEATVEWVRAHGAQSVLLWTAEQNSVAWALVLREIAGRVLPRKHIDTMDTEFTRGLVLRCFVEAMEARCYMHGF